MKVSFKRLLAVLMALAMLWSTTIPALADGDLDLSGVEDGTSPVESDTLEDTQGEV